MAPRARSTCRARANPTSHIKAFSKADSGIQSGLRKESTRCPPHGRPKRCESALQKPTAAPARGLGEMLPNQRILQNGLRNPKRTPENP